MKRFFLVLLWMPVQLVVAQENIAQGPPGSDFWDGIPREVAPGAERGDIYWMRERADAPSGSRGWNVIYVSEGADGGLDYVSGEIYLPRAPAPEPRPMVIWGVGTSGFQDSCAPSRNPLRGVNGGRARVPALEDLLASGYAVVMSDYQGLGVPGPTAYLQGDMQARASLDIARAATRLPQLEASGELGVYGFSQGGQTALWVAHLAGEYAPEFDLRGVLPIAPAARHLELSFYDLDIPENTGYFIARMAGLQVGHPQLRLRDVLTPAGLELLTAQSWGCFELFGAGAALDEPYARTDALETGSAWRERLEENDAFLPIPQSVPMLIVQGDADVAVPVELTREVRDDLCARGNQLDYREFRDAGHFGAVDRIQGDISAWFDARFSGQSLQTTCE